MVESSSLYWEDMATNWKNLSTEADEAGIDRYSSSGKCSEYWLKSID